jgi:hypothetical protein
MQRTSATDIKKLGQTWLTKNIVSLIQALEQSDKAHKGEGKSSPNRRESTPPFLCIKKLRVIMVECKSASEDKAAGPGYNFSSQENVWPKGGRLQWSKGAADAPIL